MALNVRSELSLHEGSACLLKWRLTSHVTFFDGSRQSLRDANIPCLHRRVQFWPNFGEGSLRG